MNHIRSSNNIQNTSSSIFEVRYRFHIYPARIPLSISKTSNGEYSWNINGHESNRPDNPEEWSYVGCEYDINRLTNIGNKSDMMIYVNMGDSVAKKSKDGKTIEHPGFQCSGTVSSVHPWGCTESILQLNTYTTQCIPLCARVNFYYVRKYPLPTANVSK